MIFLEFLYAVTEHSSREKYFAGAQTLNNFIFVKLSNLRNELKIENEIFLLASTILNACEKATQDSSGYEKTPFLETHLELIYC